MHAWNIIIMWREENENEKEKLIQLPHLYINGKGSAQITVTRQDIIKIKEKN